MAFIEATNLKHTFERRNEEGEVCEVIEALTGVNIRISQGEFTAILGHNGSGKSTFAKHINALLRPSEGTLLVDGMDVTDGEHLWDIRQTAGMIFQNPDNQLVAGVVEEDVAFGPENIGIPTEEMQQRVTEALESVDMLQYRKHSPSQLSGGQKQRIAIAGVLAMEPKCIIFDESTAMLDPEGRRSVLEAAEKLNREKQVTIIWITHNMEEVIRADHVFIMDGGSVTMEGTPREIFAQAEKLQEMGLSVPVITRIALQLKKDGLPLPDAMLDREELADAVAKLYRTGAEDVTSGSIEADSAAGLTQQDLADGSLETDINIGISETDSIGNGQGTENAFSSTEKSLNRDRKTDRKDFPDASEKTGVPGSSEILMTLKNISYTYGPGSPYEAKALKNVNLSIKKGEFAAVIGHTGSGKSTLLQVIGGLLVPLSGTVLFGEHDIYARGFSKKDLRQRVGLVFQYPEYQLFEMTVLKDVSFGPKNLGYSEEEATEKAKEGLRMAGLSEKYWEMSPFELSGGEKRRAAIAGVLAMHPEMLVLDEPTAGLDPGGRQELFALLKDLHEKENMTVLLVSHSMDDAAALADRIFVFDRGTLVMADTPEAVFSRREELEKIHLALPEPTYLMYAMREQGVPVSVSVVKQQAAVEETERVLRKRNVFSSGAFDETGQAGSEKSERFRRKRVVSADALPAERKAGTEEMKRILQDPGIQANASAPAQQSAADEIESVVK